MDSLLDLDYLHDENCELYRGALSTLKHLESLWFWREWTDDERQEFEKVYEIVEKYNQECGNE